MGLGPVRAHRLRGFCRRSSENPLRILKISRGKKPLGAHGSTGIKVKIKGKNCVEVDGARAKRRGADESYSSMARGQFRKNKGEA